MSFSKPQRIPQPEHDGVDSDDDRRRYQRRQNKERRELIRFNLNHVKRRSGQDRRVMAGKQNGSGN